jgi:hypothetical protein
MNRFLPASIILRNVTLFCQIKIMLTLLTLRKYIYLVSALKTPIQGSLAIYRRATGWKAGVRFPVWARDFSLPYSFQTGSAA